MEFPLSSHHVFLICGMVLHYQLVFLRPNPSVSIVQFEKVRYSHFMLTKLLNLSPNPKMAHAIIYSSCKILWNLVGTEISWNDFKMRTFFIDLPSVLICDHDTFIPVSSFTPALLIPEKCRSTTLEKCSRLLSYARLIA